MIEKINEYLTDMALLKKHEMLKHVDYDADKVETYLMFQKAFNSEQNQDIKQ